eukprot:1422381-Rhodomonas_salina.2
MTQTCSRSQPADADLSPAQPAALCVTSALKQHSESSRSPLDSDQEQPPSGPKLSPGRRRASSGQSAQRRKEFEGGRVLRGLHSPLAHPRAPHANSDRGTAPVGPSGCLPQAAVGKGRAPRRRRHRTRRSAPASPEHVRAQLAGPVHTAQRAGTPAPCRHHDRHPPPDAPRSSSALARRPHRRQPSGYCSASPPSSHGSSAVARAALRSRSRSDAPAPSDPCPRTAALHGPSSDQRPRTCQPPTSCTSRLLGVPASVLAARRARKVMFVTRTEPGCPGCGRP